MIQANVRSTTRRRRMTTKPFIHDMRLTISSVTFVLSFAHLTRRPAQPPSANTVSTKGNDRRERFSTPFAPSRS